MLPRERDPAVGEERAHDGHALLEDRHPLAVIEPENLELPFDGILDDVAGAGPENRSSVREDVEGCPGLSQLNRVPQCGHEAGSAEPYAARPL